MSSLLWAGASLSELVAEDHGHLLSWVPSLCDTFLFQKICDLESHSKEKITAEKQKYDTIYVKNNKTNETIMQE